jgi:glyoxylate reductase
MRILVTRRIYPSAIAMLKDAGFEVVSFESNKPLDPIYLSENIDKFDGILTCISEKIDSEIILKAKGKLKIISNMAVGLDNIDVRAASESGIRVFNTPDVVTGPTADMTLALAFTLIRKIKESDEFVRKGEWKAWDPEIFIGRNFSSLTWGIIGYGNIGKAVAKRLSGFGMKIIFNDPEVDRPDEFASDADIPELLGTSDIISLHMPLTEKTAWFVDSEKLNCMKNTSILINMARGGVVNTIDLINALRNKKIAGAALDVFDPEPVTGTNEILSFDNVIITPHIGTATLECRREMAEMAARNIIENLKLAI